MISILFAVFTQLQFLRKQFLESAFDLLQKNTDSFISSFCRYSTPIDRALKKEGDSFKFYKESKSLKEHKI